MGDNIPTDEARFLDQDELLFGRYGMQEASHIKMIGRSISYYVAKSAVYILKCGMYNGLIWYSWWQCNTPIPSPAYPTPPTTQHMNTHNNLKKYILLRCKQGAVYIPTGRLIWYTGQQCTVVWAHVIALITK